MIGPGALASPAAAIEIEAPEGAPWEFLVLFGVILFGPRLVERAKIPGLIGLLIGGYAIGPHGLGWIAEGSATIPDLGQIGLLYLMFLAGVELDLGLLRQHRRSAIAFGLLTFTMPMVLGVVTGLALGWSVAAALLLGSLIASHTLLLYPLVSKAGLAADPIVASAVGATVLTDTLALMVLAGVAGAETGSGTSAEIGIQIVLGITVLATFAFVLLPRIASWAFRTFGGEPTNRYVIAIAAFLAAATVGELFGIEGIVGAFFAGLALNRHVPNQGPLMGRIEFFGSAVFVPVFLVSTGLLLDPAVMVQPETLGLAGLFIAACLGGKMIAAQLTRPLLGADAPRAAIVYALSSPQAAATLAATTVGFNIGLFSESVVNAVLVLILVSVVVATVLAERRKGQIEVPTDTSRDPGRQVMVAVESPELSPLALRIAARIAGKEGGAVGVVLLVAPSDDPAASQDRLDQLAATCAAIGLDAEPQRVVAENFARGALLASLTAGASLVIAAERPGDRGSAISEWPAILAGASPAPVAIVRGEADSIGRVRLIGGADTAGSEAAKLAAEIATALSGKAPSAEDLNGRGVKDAVAAGDLAVTPVSSWGALADPLQPPAGAAILLVPEPLVSQENRSSPPEPR